MTNAYWLPRLRRINDKSRGYWRKLLLLALTLTLAWVLARWTWIFAAPQTPARAAAQETDMLGIEASRNAIASSGLFASRGTSSAPAPAPTALNIKLVGVFHATSAGQKSLAVLSMDGKANAVFGEGREIASGVVLTAVGKDHVLIRRQGALERVEFSKGASVSSPGTSAFNLDVRKQGTDQFTFSRGTLDRALQDPAQLAQLGALSVTPGVGVSVSQAPAGSLAQKLSLQPGDVVKLVNGEAVSTNEDLLRLYQKFTGTGQVTLEGVRNGAPFKQTYAVSP